MDRASRMQAFEELFNSHEAIPLEENPAAFSDLLAEQSLEASLTDEAESVPVLALEPGAGAALCPRPAGLGFVPGRTRRASTGRQTGRVQNGRATTIPAVTKQVPNASLPRVGAGPSCCQPAPCTLRPDRRNSESPACDQQRGAGRD
jgi:hypothetical protein